MIKYARIKYLISSHVNYYEKTLPKILPTIVRQISPQKIIVTIGGSESKRKIEGIETYCVGYNSFEYSSLINIVDIDYFDCEYVFLLHDTMICGDDFARLSSKIDFNKNATMAHEKAWCNLGAFRLSLLFSIKERLMSMKNISKLKAIDLEGKFFGDYETYKNPSVNLISGYGDSPYNGTKRSICKFNSVDVIKYGSNDPALLKSGNINTNL